jgi:2-keto-4-pentenoate hydratase/2-oxohepta-3-ene-1,7-dioic acid hydratase in catechol pathway
VKLCRFELKAEPGVIRSGMVYSGKIYETSGAEAIAVHEAEAVRPLMPIPNPPSLRIFRSDLQPGIIPGIDLEDPYYFYANPTALAGASQILNHPATLSEISVEPYLAAVLVTDGYQIDLETADEVILGFTMILLLTSQTAEREERRIGAIGRSHDLGGVLGPVVTTPDELEESLLDGDTGRTYGLEAILRINGVERARGNTESLPFSFAQAISAASNNSPIRAGDLIAFGPLVHSDTPILLDPGDEVQLAVEKLGALSLKISTT